MMWESNKTIPLVYLIYLSKFKEQAKGYDRILTDRARYILSAYFRIPKSKICAVLNEMSHFGLIKTANHRFIWLI